MSPLPAPSVRAGPPERSATPPESPAAPGAAQRRTAPVELLWDLGEASYGRCAVAGALLALFAIGGGLPAWAIGAGIAALVCALCALESVFGRPAEGGSAARVPDANRGPA